MAVNSTHPIYDKMLPKWKRCRDVSEGQDKIHAAGDAYLPRLKDQGQEDYDAYKKRAVFFNATWRTIAGLQGMLFRKPPLTDVPASVTPLLDTITGDAQPLRIFSLKIVEECLTVGRVGIMVDFPVVTDSNVTLADAKVLNLRPTLALYKAESILNWREENINNTKMLTRLVLSEECEEQDADDEFETCCYLQYRVLDLVEGKYRIRIYRGKATDNGGEEFEQIGEDLFPTMGGRPMAFIPFYFLGTDDTSVCPDDPPLIDLVDLNLSHYRVTADYEHGCHFTGLPTGYIAGHTVEAGDKIYLGSQHMLIFPDPTVSVGFLEFSGAGLACLEKNLARKEAQMAILGARMLEAQKVAQEATDTAALHRAGENSLLAAMSSTISLGVRQALQVFSDWAGGTGSVAFQLNLDFFPIPMDPAKLTALISSWQYGAISKETLFENLKQSEIIADAVSFEDEEAKIVNAMTLTSGMGV